MNTSHCRLFPPRRTNSQSGFPGMASSFFDFSSSRASRRLKQNRWGIWSIVSGTLPSIWKHHLAQTADRHAMVSIRAGSGRTGIGDCTSFLVSELQARRFDGNESADGATASGKTFRAPVSDGCLTWHGISPVEADLQREAFYVPCYGYKIRNTI